MYKGKKAKIQKTSVKAEKFIQDLVKQNPEVSLAREIMVQARKTQRPSVTIDQSNYYKIPSMS